ncbi:MAG: hypothetical protein GTO02_23125 [Candidatus Dadabacteria bacterium]|nr:hypothetical protein [Candidatus Dadabacteria bacterium]
MKSLYKNARASEIYLNNYRKYEIYRRIIENNCNIYGEVSGMLRYSVNQLREIYPDATFFILARDGRDVIRSIHRWRFYKKYSFGAKNITPKKDNHYYHLWPHMSRFEKICWLWSNSYEILLHQLPDYTPILQLEKLVTDYEYFYKKLCNPLDIQIDYLTWEKITTKKSKNASDEYILSSWENWDDMKKNTFNKICGDVMSRLGYIN